MEHVIEALTEEVNRLKTLLAVQLMDATDEDKQFAERLFREQQEEIAILNIELASVKKSRDEFQAESQKLKRRILALEKKVKG